jgi:hypothetical protein
MEHLPAEAAGIDMEDATTTVYNLLYYVPNDVYWGTVGSPPHGNWEQKWKDRKAQRTPVRVKPGIYSFYSTYIILFKLYCLSFVVAESSLL